MYMARTGTYHKYLDPMASFTMEYIDSILAMRLNHTYPWYVPTARVIFGVDVRKIGWRDIPYFVLQREARDRASRARIPISQSGMSIFQTRAYGIMCIAHSLQIYWPDDNALRDWVGRSVCADC